MYRLFCAKFSAKRIVIPLSVVLAIHASSSLMAQCSRGGSTATGTGAATSPVTAAVFASPLTSSSNDYAYQRAIAMQQQQMLAMQQQMYRQQQELLAMRRLVIQQKATADYAKQQELLAAKKERAKQQKEARLAAIASSRAKQNALQSGETKKTSVDAAFATLADKLTSIQNVQPTFHGNEELDRVR